MIPAARLSEEELAFSKASYNLAKALVEGKQFSPVVYLDPNPSTMPAESRFSLKIKASVASAPSVSSIHTAIITSLEHQAPDYIRVEAIAFSQSQTLNSQGLGPRFGLIIVLLYACPDHNREGLVLP